MSDTKESVEMTSMKTEKDIETGDDDDVKRDGPPTQVDVLPLDFSSLMVVYLSVVRLKHALTQAVFTLT